MFIPTVNIGTIIDHSARGLQITATYRIGDFRGRRFTVLSSTSNVLEKLVYYFKLDLALEVGRPFVMIMI
jgi:hypothetical protein